MSKSLSSFSLTDLLNYVFPGYIALIAVCLLSNFITDWQMVVQGIGNTSWELGLLSIPAAYFLGVVSSSLIRWTAMTGNGRSTESHVEFPLKNPLLGSFADNLIEAYRRRIGKCNDWSRENYYLVRTFVREQSPTLADYGNRQIALRHLRRNCVIPTVLWGALGVIHGIGRIDSGSTVSGVSIIALSALATTAIVIALLRAASRNRLFEIRDYCVAFLILVDSERTQPPSTPVLRPNA